MSGSAFVYILTNRRNGTLYVGVTSDLARRVEEHKRSLVAGFSADYGLHRLVYFEAHDEMMSAISREKRLKRWRRTWKLELIEQRNPYWRDLSGELQR